VIERLHGTDRTDDPLLNLDEAFLPFRVLVMSSQWYATYLFGMAGAPIGIDWQRRYRKPKPGELCFATDHAINPRAEPGTAMKSFGYFLGEQQEPIYDDETWAEVQDQYDDQTECPTERIFYIQYGPKPDDVCRWENAQCQVIATRAISDELHDRWRS
jgi:hypothetical protein